MANTPAYALTTISGGINRLRTKGGADKNSLYDLLNGYVTQSSTVKVRPGTFRNANIATYSGAGATKGLLAYQNTLHVFSSAVVPVPPGYTLHVLNYPATSSLTVTSPAGGDPNWGSVALLLPFDGANGQMTTADVSNYGNPVTINAGALTTANPKFGTASFLSTSANFLNTYAAAVPFTGAPLDVFATPEWTIECFVRCNTNTGVSFIFCDYGGSTSGLPTTDMLLSASMDVGNTTLTVSATNAAAFTLGGGQVISASAASGLSVWHHVALVGHAGAVTIYLDGVAGASNVLWTPASYTPSGAKSVVIGSYSRYSGGRSVGQVDEFRVTNMARYTANFVPPAVAFAISAPSVPIKEIHFAAPYLGGIYVVAEFNVPANIAAQFGDTFHYWVQSSTGGDNSNQWKPKADYRIGDVVIPSSPNGLTFIASRRLPANPVWTPNTAQAVNNVVEPVTANGFQYAATAVLGASPTTGAVEPTWPTKDGGVVNENSALAVDQTITLAAAANPVATSTTPKRYTGIAGGFKPGA